MFGELNPSWKCVSKSENWEKTVHCIDWNSVVGGPRESAPTFFEDICGCWKETKGTVFRGQGVVGCAFLANGLREVSKQILYYEEDASRWTRTHESKIHGTLSINSSL